MIGRHRKRRRSRRFIVVRRWLWMTIFLVVCFFGWLALPRSSKMAAWQRASSDSESGANAFIKPPSETKGVLALEANREPPVRVIYPYSVVLGGVRSVEELKLEKGETLITDGVNTARTRCGNLISETVSEPVFPNEPTVQEMDAPLNPPETGIQTASDVPPDPPLTQIPGINMAPVEEAPPPPPIENDPVILLPPGPPGIPWWPAPPPPRHVVSVPEPRTLVLLLIGFISVVLLRKRGAHRSHQHVG